MAEPLGGREPQPEPHAKQPPNMGRWGILVLVALAILVLAISWPTMTSDDRVSAVGGVILFAVLVLAIPQWRQRFKAPEDEH